MPSFRYFLSVPVYFVVAAFLFNALTGIWGINNLSLKRYWSLVVVGLILAFAAAWQTAGQLHDADADKQAAQSQENKLQDQLSDTNTKLDDLKGQMARWADLPKGASTDEIVQKIIEKLPKEQSESERDFRRDIGQQFQNLLALAGGEGAIPMVWLEGNTPHPNLFNIGSATMPEVHIEFWSGDANTKYSAETLHDVIPGAPTSLTTVLDPRLGNFTATITVQNRQYIGKFFFRPNEVCKGTWDSMYSETREAHQLSLPDGHLEQIPTKQIYPFNGEQPTWHVDPRCARHPSN
jgi:hypothetical protein